MSHKQLQYRLIEYPIIDIDEKVVGKISITKSFRDRIVNHPYGIHFTVNDILKLCEVHDRTESEKRLDDFLYQNFTNKYFK